MIEVELNRYDYAAALIFAEHFIKGKQQGLWSLQSISLYYQNKIFNALKIMGKVSEALAMSQEITQRLEAEALDTPESRRDLSIFYNKVGDMFQQSGDHASAFSAYQKGLAISEALAEALDTPESRRDLSVSYARLAQIAEANSDKALAIHYFLQGLEYAKIYQLKQQCPDADQLIAFFEREIQRLQMIND